MLFISIFSFLSSRGFLTGLLMPFKFGHPPFLLLAEGQEGVGEVLKQVVSGNVWVGRLRGTTC